MTAPEPMTREELLELADADVLGLLEEYEQALFARSFHYASTAVQDEITRKQAELSASLGDLHDMEDPPPALRSDILNGVRAAAEKEASRLAPLATIGVGGGTAGINGGHTSAVPRHRQSARTGGSGLFWRAASFVLAASVMIITYFFIGAVIEGRNIAKLALEYNTRQQLDTIGPTFADFFLDSRSVKVSLSPVGEAQVAGSVLVREDLNAAFIAINGLPETTGNVYSIRISDAEGRMVTLEQFNGPGKLTGRRFDREDLKGITLTASTRWEVHGPDGLILTSV